LILIWFEATLVVITRGGVLLVKGWLWSLGGAS
jgi:hypothetical protein